MKKIKNNNNNKFSFKEWLISSTYKTPFINFIFSTNDFIIPKFVNFEEYRSNIQKFNEIYITETILNHNVQTVKLMNKNLKSKFLLLDVGLAYNENFKNDKERKNNLLVIVDETKEYFEIIFINTPELYEEYSYVVKRFYKKDKYYTNNLNNLTYLFMYYSLVTNGVSIISKNKIKYFDEKDVYYLSKKEQQDIFKKVKPFESKVNSFFKVLNILLLFFMPLIISNYIYFTYKKDLIIKYSNENNRLYNKIINLNNKNKKLKNDYKKLFKTITNKKEFYKTKKDN